MTHSARQPLTVERLVRLLHAATLDGSIVRAKLTLHFVEALPRGEADELADRAAARAARILGAAKRSIDLGGCEAEVISGVNAALASTPSRVRSLELELFTAASGSGLRRKVDPTAEELEAVARGAAERKPSLPPGAAPAPPMLAAPILVRALHEAAATLADVLLWQHEKMRGRDRADGAPAEERRSSQWDRSSAAALERATHEAAARVADLMRWQAALGYDAVERVQNEAALAATYLMHRALASPNVPRSATTALTLAIARKAFPDAPLSRELWRYLDTEASLHTTLARAVATILGAPHTEELTDALVWAVPSAREVVREAVRVARG